MMGILGGGGNPPLHARILLLMLFYIANNNFERVGPIKGRVNGAVGEKRKNRDWVYQAGRDYTGPLCL